MVQEERSRGFVYLILTGYCDVVVFDGEDFQTVASLQAGEIIGEMAIVTGSLKRNASVVASSPVSVMVFSEEHFNQFIVREGYKDKLLKRWDMRDNLRILPQFWELISTVLEKVSAIADKVMLEPGQELVVGEADRNWYIFSSGDANLDRTSLAMGDEFCIKPFSTPVTGKLVASQETSLMVFSSEKIAALLKETPQLNYQLRKFRVNRKDPAVDWLLGEVETY